MNQTTSLPHLPRPFPPGPATGRSLAGAPTSAGRPSSWSAPAHSAAAETLQSRFALRVASRLTEGSQRLSPEIAERLRFAREQALVRAGSSRTAGAGGRVGVMPGGAALLGGLGSRRGGPGTQGRRAGGWWFKLASVLPVFALVGGLILIERWQDNAQVSVAAEIDASLLSDDLPPTAYSDAGFGEFLKNPGQ